MFDFFNGKMSGIFDSVNNRVWTETNYYDEYVESGETMDLD